MTGIKVTCVCPLFVDTGFVRNPKINFVGKIYQPEEVVDVTIKGVLRNKQTIYLPNLYWMQNLMT